MGILCAENSRRERLLAWIAAVLVICISWVSPIICQSNYLSIDCGSSDSYYDNTGIFWVPDDDYISTGINIQNISTQSYYAIPNKRQASTLRYFDDSRSRNCYVLPAQSGATYLVRGTFFYGSLGNGSIAIEVYVWVDDSGTASFRWDAGQTLFQSYQFEIIYWSPRDKINVCLFGDGGPSFISTLELRKLDSDMYSSVVGPELNYILSSLTRVNCGPPESGGTQLWRYPDDAYDRFWYLYGRNPAASDNYTHISTNISSFGNSSASDPNQAPVVVMRDAWVEYDQDMLTMLNPYTSTIGPTYISAFFQEVDGNASATNVRGMDYYVNGQFIESFNSSDQPFAVSTYKNIQDLLLNISIVRSSWSRLPPILNAFEVYQIFSLTASQYLTIADDVAAVNALQIRLGLQEWIGDPCFPVNYDWLSCSRGADYVFQRVTGVKLAHYGLGGNIPLELVNLTELTSLDLNNNTFSGSIPDLSGLVHLQQIFLQNNNLSGELPSFLGSAFPNLTTLDVGNNNLSGTVPSDLIRPLLNFTFSNNAHLRKPPASKRAKIGAVVGGILGGLLGLAVLIWVIWMIATRKRRARDRIIRAIALAEARVPGSSRPSRRALAGSMVLLSLQDVSNATKTFSRKIGEGSFGPVYYGKLPSGQEVAVKVKSTESTQGTIEFLNEVELLSRIHHRNLVSLIGYCEEGNQQILVYAYVSNGTLREHLYGDKSRKTLDWATRLDMALNSAKGLEYLHNDCTPRIIHRDVKSSNILIDENMVAKVADFGISKQTPEGIFTGLDTVLKGTPGYFDPEYFSTQRLTQKSDVYSFGVVLLEIISGRHPNIDYLPDGSATTLVQWVRHASNTDNVIDIVDPKLKGRYNAESMKIASSLAIKSIDPATDNRPDMAQVVRALKAAIDLELYSEINVNTDFFGNGPIAEGTEYQEVDDSTWTFSVNSLPGSGVPLIGNVSRTVNPR